jgi:divalent metal cation (Fe/Co/Zn/Cd) transporter
MPENIFGAFGRCPIRARRIHCFRLGHMKAIATIIASLFILALGLWLAWCVVSAFRSGIAHAAGGLEYPRKKKPVMYWLAVLAQTFFSIVCIYSVVLCIERFAR